MLKPILIAGLLGVNLSAWAVVDWTPYFKGMKNECDFETLEPFITGKNKIPKKLQPSITKYIGGAYNNEKTDIRLKNATAFGQPITRIVIEHPETAYGSLTIYFANASFTKLKSQFTVNVNGTRHAVGKAQAWGITGIPTGKTDEYGTPIMKLSYTPISQQQMQKIEKNYWSGEAKETSGFDGGLGITNDGFSIFHPNNVDISFQIKLTFDAKNKSITCTHIGV